ncbi:hypothetical protein CEXT_352931 [Caerostris extrusa]|uniref:Uncharacterized protein n=1 Tax=Caerostris extrusa TaxID=172846 RepID=A0AAV4WJC1_CAEEX|nr:hypothetical protein CEXT_352931 [Caerostris extrusa]
MVRHPFGIPPHRNFEAVDVDYRPQKARPPFITAPEKFPNIHKCSNAGPLQILTKKVMTQRLDNVQWNACCAGEETRGR